MTNLSKKNLLKILQILADGHHDQAVLMGELTNLTTDEKGSLVGAINELKSAINSGLDSVQVNNLINQRVNELLDGAPTAFDTLKEIADKLSSDDTAINAILTKLTALQTKDTEFDTRLTTLENKEDFDIPDEWLPDIQRRMSTGA